MRKDILGILMVVLVSPFAHGQDVLPETKPLAWKDDIASRMVDGVDRFLLRELRRSAAHRGDFWKRDPTSPAAYNASIEANRKRLAHILGVRDSRRPFDGLELVGSTSRPALVGRGRNFKIFAVRWPVVRDVHGEGLLLVPDKVSTPAVDVVAIPDADQTPEQLVGLVAGVPAASQFARHLAERGCRVVVPVLISREMQRRAPPGQSGRANLSHREYIYRSAFELGRHVIGYELQKVLACVDWFEREANGTASKNAASKVGVIGYGEGGMLSLFAGALDTRIDVAAVSGLDFSRENMWQEPLDRNVFGLLEQFGGAELATMVMPRTLLVENLAGPRVTLPGQGGAPAELGANFDPGTIERVRKIATTAVPSIGGQQMTLAVVDPPAGVFCSAATVIRFVDFCRGELPPAEKAPVSGEAPAGSAPQWNGPPTDAVSRQRRQIDELDRHNQWLLSESPFVRKEYMGRLDTSSVEKYEQSVESYRTAFRKEVIGEFGHPAQPFNPRTRKSWETEKWTGYEVALDLWEEVFAYGVLIVPKDLKLDGSEKRPVVVCQHGLEGRPTDTFLNDHRAYHDFAGKLAERGFITFAPQNLYIFRDRFRTLQRKANPLGKSLFSVIVPQHQQIVDWLQSLPFVDAERVAFYGLSYGGKTAMRVPALVTDYCLSICSADFNEWVRKNASSRLPFSYVWTGEYEIFEFDLGSTFNYAEMAALICPRPFMVERGHFDGVGWDEWVAYEFAKVRHLYQARLHIGDRTEIEWFVGPHTINGQGTFDFLHKHLRWPR